MKKINCKYSTRTITIEQTKKDDLTLYIYENNILIGVVFGSDIARLAKEEK